MNLNDIGWLKFYIKFRQKKQSDATAEAKNSPPTLKEDQLMYRSAQPTGIMYGHPIIPAGLSEELHSLNVQERMKLVLVENFIHTNKFDSELLKQANTEDFSYELATNLINYYLNVFPEIETNTHNIMGKMRSKEEIAEQIIKKRLLTKRSLFENIWIGYFHNSLLFIDVFFFKIWSESADGLKTIDSLRKGKDGIRLVLLKIIAAAANADNQIEKEERKLFTMFLKSARLDKESESEARKFIDSNISLDDIDFPEMDSWLLKKYFLEIAILTAWSDKTVNKAEHRFVNELGTKLGFTSEEVEDSFAAIEVFVLTNWDKLDFI